MAQKRMFDMSVVDTDIFLEMPQSTQNLYFHFGMRADDDGFVSNPRKIQKMVGASDDDYKILLAKMFIIPFESGICVIRHWKINNYLRADRKKDTVYTKEKSMLNEDENGVYSLGIPNDYQMSTKCLPSIDKNSIEEISIDNIPPIIPQEKYFDNETLNDKFQEYLKMRVEKKCKATPTTVKSLIDKLNKYDVPVALTMLQYSIDNGYQGVFEPKKDKPYQPIQSNDPEWLNKKIEAQQATEEEEAQLKAMLSEFK